MFRNCKLIFILLAKIWKCLLWRTVSILSFYNLMYILKIIWELIGTMKFVCCRKIFLFIQTTRTNLPFNKHIDKVCDNVSVLARIHSVKCTSSIGTVRTGYPFLLNALWFVITVKKMWRLWFRSGSRKLLKVTYSLKASPSWDLMENNSVALVTLL